MKKLITVIAFALSVVFANAAIEVGDITFPADEVSATNPRIERFYEESLSVLGITKELGDTILSQCISTPN